MLHPRTPAEASVFGVLIALTPAVLEPPQRESPGIALVRHNAGQKESLTFAPLLAS
jgi:hypothetical protein